jgi:hypothetical protein
MVSYKMLARDVNSSPIQYRTWVVNDTPDFTGALYTGDKSGPAPFVDVSAYAIFNPGEVVDFNLPDPLSWNTTYKVLPSYICDSQLAIIDGYVYLFGGQNSNKILRASVDNPADFVDTGATLPTHLAGSQLAIINNVIYLFGGTTDATLTSATANILSAPVSNPLAWTNNGALLPRPLHHSQLAVIGDNIYLFGGNGSNNASNVIYTAALSSPLAWTDTGSKLPDPLYGSQLAIINGSVYLLGGLLATNSSTGNIYAATLTQPLTWNQVGKLPYPICYGQFAAIGDRGYLFTPTATTASNTRILRCQLSSPSSWTDTKRTVHGSISQSQLAIVYDRIFLYGGNGSTIIVANNSIVKYQLDTSASFSYGNITRTQADAAPSETALFQILGFKPWVTDYGSFNF